MKHPTRRPSLAALGSETEITAMLKAVYDALPDDERAALDQALAEIKRINKVGTVSALRLVLVADPETAAGLDKLDAAVIAHKEAQ